VDAVTALFDDVVQLLDADTVVQLASASGGEAAETHGKYQRLKYLGIVGVERAIDEDLIGRSLRAVAQTCCSASTFRTASRIRRARSAVVFVTGFVTH
jgi:hypothetical protein